ncbi:MAG: flagellar hook protein FlgE [Maricaulaceae bacterium]
MSLNGALIAGNAALIANSSALSALSDNIANVNTVGFRRFEADFNSLNANLPGTAAFNASGVSATVGQNISAQGLLQATTSPTDLAISGDGFFVVTNGPTFTPQDPINFTRAGNFLPNEDGFLVNSAGFFLQGFPVDANGDVTDNTTDISQLAPVNIGSIGGTAEPTTNIIFDANLQASTPVSAAAAAPPTFDPSDPANNLSSGAVTADFQRSVQIFDSQGGLREIVFSFLRADPAGPEDPTNPAGPLAGQNAFYAEISIVPPTDVITGAGLDGANGQLATGIVRFDTAGQIDLANTTLPLTLDFLSSQNAAALGPTEFQFAGPNPPGPNTPTAGVGAQSVTINFGGPGSAGGLTQFDSPSELISTFVDGANFGDLAGVEVDADGFLVASFENGAVRPLFQIPLATFPNPDGLAPVPGTAFAVTVASGAFTLRTNGEGGAGAITPNALEASTVDLSTEFSGLIQAQQAFSAASRIVQTADELLTELIQVLG